MMALSALLGDAAGTGPSLPEFVSGYAPGRHHSLDGHDPIARGINDDVA